MPAQRIVVRSHGRTPFCHCRSIGAGSVSDVSDVGSSLAPAQGTTTRTEVPVPEGKDLRELGVLFRSLLDSPRKAREWADATGGSMQQASMGAELLSQPAA